MSASPIARRLLEATAAQHPVISVVFDLNPAEFATAPARAPWVELRPTMYSVSGPGVMLSSNPDRTNSQRS